MTTSNGASAFSMAATIAAVAGIVPPSPRALDAERVERRRRLLVGNLDRRHLGRDGQQIFAVIVVQRLSALVVHQPFEQCIADPVDHAAHDLPVHHHRVDHLSAIVRDRVAQHPHLAGADIDLDLCNVGTGCGRHAVRGPVGSRLKPRRESLRQRPARHRRELFGELPVCDFHLRHARDADDAVLHLQILDRCLQPLGGKLQRLVPNALRGIEDRRRCVDRDAAADGAHALREGAGIGGHDVDVLQRHVQPVGADLGQHRLVSLALARRAGLHQHLAVGLDTDGRSLVWPDAGILDAARNPDPR